MVKWLLLFFVSGIIVFATTLYFKLGSHLPVQLEDFKGPAYHLIYKEHTGSYHKITHRLEEVEQWAAENNIPCHKTFGLYLDNPQVIEELRLRSEGGCVTTHEVSSLPKDFHFKTIPSTKYLKATFHGSPSIGPFKVYPKAKEWFAQKRIKMEGPVLEIYEMNGLESMTTTYLFPIPRL